VANLTIVVNDGILKKARMCALEEDTWRWTALIYGEKFEEALTYAARLHRTQMRKGTNVPYVTHLLAVAAIVGENGGTEDEVIAALLHDAVEDQGGVATREEIRKRFGDTVVTIVDGTSDTDVIPKPP
jgi:(p)ppGpp synthase/HD superfamily hydrolase